MVWWIGPEGHERGYNQAEGEDQTECTEGHANLFLKGHVFVMSERSARERRA